MQITISDKKIAEAVGIVVDQSIIEYFDTPTLKAAGLKRSELVKAVMADTKFLTSLSKMIASDAVDMDVLVDRVYDANSKVIADADAKCESVYDEVHAEERRRQEADTIKQTIAHLEGLGYKVTKA